MKLKYESLALAAALFCSASVAVAETPFKVLFDFSRTSSSQDRDHYFGERQPGRTFDVNVGGTNLIVAVAGYLTVSTKTNAWLLLNDTNPNTLDVGPTNANDLKVGTNLVVRTRLEYLSSATSGEDASIGILFGLNGSGPVPSGYLARVDRGIGNASVYIDQFVNGARSSMVASNGNHSYGAAGAYYFIELKVSSDGVTTNAIFNLYADSAIPGTGSNSVRLVDAAFDTATPLMSVTNVLSSYSGGFVALYFEDNTSANATNPNLGIGRFSNFYAKSGTPFSDVSIVATATEASEGTAPGSVVIYRSTPDATTINTALTVNYAVSGSSSNGLDYPWLAGTAIIPIGATNATLTIVPTDDLDSELTESLTITVMPGTNYFLAPPDSATITIFDNDPTKVGIFASDTNAWERVTDLAGAFTVVRYGDTNGEAAVNIGFSGDATNGIDYNAVTVVNLAAGEITQVFTVAPTDNSAYTGDRSVVATILAGTAYTPAPDNSAAISIIDDELPPETVLWSDNFDSGTSTNNYNLTTASRLPPDDYFVDFAFDYSTVGIPAAPNSTNTIGFKVTANKTSAHSASVNCFPIGQSFSNNFALRFNLYMSYGLLNSEQVIFGINHSGSSTNYRNASFASVVTGDGLWVGLNINETPSVTLLAGTMTAGGVVAANMTQLMQSPPFGVPGGFGNPVGSPTPTWIDCELSQVGNLITLKLNNTAVLQYTNVTAYTNGTIMLGYNDLVDSVGSMDGYGVLENVRVVALANTAPPVITGVSVFNGVAQLDFTGSAGDTAGSFKLQSSGVVAGGYADNNSATITALGGNAFRFTTSISGDAQFYRIRRQ